MPITEKDQPIGRVLPIAQDLGKDRVESRAMLQPISGSTPAKSRNPELKDLQPSLDLIDPHHPHRATTKAILLELLQDLLDPGSDD